MIIYKDSLQYQRFCEKVASKTSHVKPQALPPTSGAAKYHSLHVYLQVQEWKRFADELHPTGKSVMRGLCHFRHHYLLLLHEHLLKVIRQADSITRRCTRKRHECTSACGNCRGSGCTNVLHEDDVVMHVKLIKPQ